ncbi:hypothetical protein L917_20238 [Phytophthora nicotianae]|uniref:Uncharacterized protein n=1 Tax=Phytophthora nicotianae TaxID=4792 RepID=W2K3C3_PHYNI|nr:hypothetical protein L917_20238 [Phytophthora nicotianae]
MSGNHLDDATIKSNKYYASLSATELVQHTDYKYLQLFESLQTNAKRK